MLLGGHMLSIKSNNNKTAIVSKSKFISFLYKVNNIDDINNILNNLKNEYKDSTHICYAYILNNLEKAFDDGEPKNSAGKPMLDALKKNNLNYILSVVVRYYGGIKLGKGNLTRTYKNCISELIRLNEIVEVVKHKNITITINHDLEKIINKILSNNKYNIVYKEIIEYNLDADDELIDSLNKIDGVNLIINNDVYIEKPITK